MNRDTFNLLSIDKQVEFFNKMLKTDNFNSICKGIGISKNTIKKRFESNGYTENRKGQIIKSFIKKVIKEIEQEENIIEHKESKKKEVKNITIDNKNLELIFKRLKTLESEVTSLKKSIKNSNDNKNITEVIQYFEGETVIKTFKIDKEVYRELEKLQKAFKGYKKQDVVSSLLKYAISNIK